MTENNSNFLPLPPGWVQYEAPGGIPFYFHKDSNISTWTHPSAPTPQPSVTSTSLSDNFNNIISSSNNNNSTTTVNNPSLFLLTINHQQDYLTSPARTRAILETKKERLREQLVLRDGILQPDVTETIQEYCKSSMEIGSSLSDAVEDVSKMLAENYVGSGDICSILVDWLNLLKPNNGGDFEAKEHMCQMISQRVPHTQTDDVDGLLLKSEFAPQWLATLLNEKQYRTLLIELSNQRKSSILFDCCVRAIAEKGFHDEVAQTAGTATAHYVVFLKTFCASMIKLLNIVEKNSLAVNNTNNTHTNDPKRQRISTTSSSNTTTTTTAATNTDLPNTFDTFTRTENELIQLAESAPHALALVYSILTEFEQQQHSAAADAAIIITTTTTTNNTMNITPQLRALCTRLRQRLRNPFPLSLSRSVVFQHVEVDSVRKNIDEIESLVADIINTDDYDVCPKVVRLSIVWKNLYDTTTSSTSLLNTKPLLLTANQQRSLAETLCEKRFMNRVLDSLFRPFRSDISIETRLACAKVLAVIAGGGIESPELVDAIRKSSEICNSVGPGGVPSQVHGIIEYVIKHPTISVASMIWANTLLLTPTFQKSISFFTGVSSLCRLCDIVSYEHPLHRQYVLSLLRCALDLKSVTDKRVLEYCDLIIESMIRLACEGYVIPVLEYWSSKADTHDASTLRSFLGGIMKRVKPPFSIEFKTKFQSLLNSPAGSRAVTGGGIEFVELKKGFNMAAAASSITTVTTSSTSSTAIKFSSS
jgi:hypothetical protein